MNRIDPRNGAVPYDRMSYDTPLLRSPEVEAFLKKGGKVTQVPAGMKVMTETVMDLMCRGETQRAALELSEARARQEQLARVRMIRQAQAGGK